MENRSNQQKRIDRLFKNSFGEDKNKLLDYLKFRYFTQLRMLIHTNPNRKRCCAIMDDMIFAA
jgi:hypothetical protein